MGTNYYFHVKNRNKIIREISDLIEKTVKFLNPAMAEKFVPEKIHICKFSAGWSPLFEGTDYYKTIDELTKFYEDNKETLLVVSEYGSEIDFYDFLRQCKNRRDEASSRRMPDMVYRLCQDNFEWLDSDFF